LQLDVGPHTVAVQAHSGYNWDDGTAISSAVITVVAPVAGASTWQGVQQSATAPSWGQAVSISGTLRDATGTALSGAPVRVQSSSNGVSFADVSGATVTNLPSGVYLTSVTPLQRTYYRLAFAGSGVVAGSSSSVAVVVPQVSLSTPSAKSTSSHKVKLKVSGTLRPSHRSSSRTVKLRIERWNGHRWVGYGSVWTRVTRHNSSYSTYSAKIRLRSGRFRLHADAPADSLHALTHSGYKTVTVK
ncbi:MAG TPA: carboxypeptidase-like regulatory domain-containing protein, partial [Candidatus Limnocylindrales bacterium]